VLLEADSAMAWRWRTKWWTVAWSCGQWLNAARSHRSGLWTTAPAWQV